MLENFLFLVWNQECQEWKEILIFSLLFLIFILFYRILLYAILLFVLRYSEEKKIYFCFSLVYIVFSSQDFLNRTELFCKYVSKYVDYF